MARRKIGVGATAFCQVLCIARRPSPFPSRGDKRRGAPYHCDKNHRSLERPSRDEPGFAAREEAMLHHPLDFDWGRTVPIRRRLRFPADAVIASGGEPAERTFYLLLEGTVRLSLMTADGREQAMVYLPRGSLFGEQAALRSEERRVGKECESRGW